MERQNTKKLMPLDLLDLQGNEAEAQLWQLWAPGCRSELSGVAAMEVQVSYHT